MMFYLKHNRMLADIELTAIREEYGSFGQLILCTEYLNDRVVLQQQTLALDDGVDAHEMFQRILDAFDQAEPRVTIIAITVINGEIDRYTLIFEKLAA